MLPDPQAALTEARERHDQARSRQADLQDLSEKISVASRQAEDVGRQASDLDARQRQVRDTVIPTAHADLAALAATASQFAAQRDQLDADRERRRRDAHALAELLRQADEDGEGIEALASAASTVTFLGEQLPNLLAEAAGGEQEARDLETLSNRLKDVETSAASLKAQAADEQAEASRLAAAASTASEQVSHARTRLSTARNCAGTLSSLDKAVRDATERKSRAAEAIEPAAARVRAAIAERDEARSALEAIKRANAAAHAADGCQPGDPCPICQRPLPADFDVPAPPGDAGARVRQTAAERAAEQAVSALAARQADLTSASDDLERADRAAQEAGRTLSDALAQLRLIILDPTSRLMIKPC